MTIYNIYIFDKFGTLLYYAEWNRIKQSGITKEEEAKLMYGMLYSLKSFTAKMSPIDSKEGFLQYRTNKYALHYFETATGLKFVLNTDNASTGVRELLQQLYAKVWVEYVNRNPLWVIGTPVTSDLFKAKLDEFIKQSPLYSSKSI
uniref:Trafficking protein particle complex subunit n=1 Tax=Culicoides sonorensis TaxID=179676 RepID=A0A336KJX7_CULSO